ncbi:MMPL family transporter [Actinospica sp. MGRD01-02]|uniref:MMPL family transporter n=1 Tax=Actinospica acidithermotolerans TaxID=2828514 RepID=A0A941IIW5_9ACTN|nr:MMPL family transporter [Actinospica acidithermotolerans]MBR7826558.1 MMPL family transporter [Actinospica acidithermotolerans]
MLRRNRTRTPDLPASDGEWPRGLLARAGGWCARHAWTVVAVWLLILIGATVGHRALGGTYADDFNLSGSPSVTGINVLQAHDPAAGGQSGQIVFAVASGQLSTAESAIETSIGDVRKLPHVLSATDPLAGATTSKDGRTAYSTVQFDTNPVDLGSSYVAQVEQATAPARAAGVQVNYGETLGTAARPVTKDTASEGAGIAVAIIVLLVGFGSVLAAGLPIISALIGGAAGLGLLGMLAAATTFATVSPTLAIMMGLGVGIDYGLFLITRHRQQVIDGVAPDLAAARTLASSGRAVLTAALTVIVALLGLYASGLSFIGKLGLAAGITVAVGALSALTLVPALLGMAGRRIDRLRVRKPIAESAQTGSGWHAYAALVGRRPVTFLLGGLLVLCALAIPALSLRLGHIDAGADPVGYTDRVAYDQMSAAFGPGTNGPFTIVVDVQGIDAGRVSGLKTSLRSGLSSTADVASVAPIKATSDGDVLITTVTPVSGPQDAATVTLMSTLRDSTLPKAVAGTSATGYVTGTIALQLDFRNQVSSRLPLIIVVVIAAAFLLLLASFRSPVLALKAALCNLFSLGAAYGVVVAVFQWGWGSSLLGVGEKVPIESYVPMMMFAIVFGLSMDYEVFLLSRVREAWLARHDNHESVATGLSVTARVISCAALIMASVFFAFMLSNSVVVKMLALGLGVSVLIDATVVRLVIVPAAMFLMGSVNWWIPRWLDRILPHLGEEPIAERVAEADAEPVSS